MENSQLSYVIWIKKHFQLKVVNWWSSSYHNSDICLSNNFRTQHFSIMTGSWGGVTDSRHDVWPAGISGSDCTTSWDCAIIGWENPTWRHNTPCVLTKPWLQCVAYSLCGQRAVRGLPARTPSTPRTIHSSTARRNPVSTVVFYSILIVRWPRLA